MPKNLTAAQAASAAYVGLGLEIGEYIGVNDEPHPILLALSEHDNPCEDTADALLRIAALRREIEHLRPFLSRAEAMEAERDRLHALINSPQTAEFLPAVAAEKAHQIERWGTAHDRSKSAEHWFWLVGYLAGKALRASISGDRQKALHHTISSAAALANWHDAITTDNSGKGVGQDADLSSHNEPSPGVAA